MALTQTATLRPPGPSWDEEVVPALRKRLQSESQTLTKRMSAISLSGDEVVVGGTYSAYNGTTSTSPTRQPTTTYTSTPQYRIHGRDSVDSEYASGSAMAPANPSRHPNTAQRPAPNTTMNGSSRSRTYSQPDGVKMNLKVANGSASKPTRIPKPSRPTYATYSNGNTPVVPQTNGFAGSSPPLEDYSYNGPAYFPSSSTSKSLGGLAASQNRSTSGLMNESPPFPPSSSSTSLAYSPNTTMNGYHHDEGSREGGGFMDTAPSRQSMESEEQPFEHWYRGEVSRNGGVGELRVGKRQEMLDIANYGHMMKQAKLKVSPQWGPAPDRVVPHHSTGGRRRQRRRAGSIGGLTDVERVRESVYFDEDGMEQVSRVLDENPLTDLEDEALQSDVASLASFHRVEHDYLPGVGDISTTRVMTPTPEEEVLTPRMPSEDRSSTPTQSQLSHSQRGQYPPTRIPGPSRARKTSENRASPPALNTSTRSGLNASTSTTSTAKTANAPPMAASGSRSVSGQSIAASQSNPKNRQPPSTPVGKRRTPVKSLKGKQTPVKLPQKDKRQSVGQYPAVDNEEDLADAIPTWTQPVPRSGNWDEVVLPVVARNKGMDEYYRTANGRPQPKQLEDRLEPAPGTFGIKDWKNRTHRNGDEFIPLDEFGVPERDDDDDDRHHQYDQQSNNGNRPHDWPRTDSFNKHEQTVLPVRGDPPPSPPPFAQYVPQKPEVDSVAAENGAAAVVDDNRSNRRHNERREEEGAGCCKCSIM